MDYYNSKKNQSLEAQTAFTQSFRRLFRGVMATLHAPAKALVVCLVLVLLRVLWGIRYRALNYTPEDWSAPMRDDLLALVLFVFASIFSIALFWLWGGPWETKQFQNNLIRCGFTNAVKEAPILISKQQSPDNPRITIFEFFSCGIPLDEWIERTTTIDAALNITTADTQQGKDNQHICVYAVPGTSRLPGMIPWCPEYATGREGLVVLGESLLGPVVQDLNVLPMTIIGGTTGSGKTQTAVLMAYQLLQQSAKIIIVDYKGCADWDVPAFDDCPKATSPEELLPLLDACMKEMERRKVLFREVHARNITEYREKTGESLPRLVICIDEAADVLGQNVSKEEKPMAAQIERAFEKISRQGRSSAVNLLLSIQRPDSSISGQIRSNCPARYCGRGDRILRDIVLGDSIDDTVQLPDVPGRFLSNDGTVFQTYYFDGYSISNF